MHNYEIVLQYGDKLKAWKQQGEEEEEGRGEEGRERGETRYKNKDTIFFIRCYYFSGACDGVDGEFGIALCAVFTHQRKFFVNDAWARVCSCVGISQV
jgi:hypothetical protein